MVSFLVICVQHSESAGIAEEGSSHSFHSSCCTVFLFHWTKNQLSCAQTNCSRGSYVFSHWQWGNRLHLVDTKSIGYSYSNVKMIPVVLEQDGTDSADDTLAFNNTFGAVVVHVLGIQCSLSTRRNTHISSRGSMGIWQGLGSVGTSAAKQ